MLITAIGCGDPEVTAGEWFERGNNETTVHCPTSGASWRLICIGNEWKGQRGNCTLDETVESKKILLQSLDNFIKALLGLLCV